VPSSHSERPEEDKGAPEPLPDLRTDQARASAQLVRWSFICSLPTLILFALTISELVLEFLNPGPRREPRWGHATECFYFLAFPSAPFSLLFGIFDIFRKPYVLLWLIPVAAFWGLSFVIPMLDAARQ
jgi:hypothetical protein